MTDEAKLKDQLNKSLVKLKEAKEIISTLHEPIAIIGMGCRFPGDVCNPEEFWELLTQEKDGIIDVPASRWDIDAYYDPDKDTPGKMYVRKGGFLQQPIDTFDAEYFGISPREAEDMDPQQRLSLEVAIEALEGASIPISQLKGSNTGVYMGICFNDYGHLITQSRATNSIDNYYSTGNHYSILSGRIAYCLGFTGPAISIDTACSSSLVTIDTAVKDLRLGRIDLALAGGVNLILAPESTINFCKSGMLSPEGYCKTFDASANGYVRGEGCGIIVLKRLSDAIKDRNHILAVIRGTAVNQDGASSGLTVPNGLAQQNVIQQALSNAKVLPSEISYVEAHGTGTSLGDPIEVEALAQVYSKDRDRAHPLLIGSVKTNIGHTEAAAGVAGVIKVVLSLIHREIPKHLHFQKLNQNIHVDQLPISIAQKRVSLKSETPLLAAVSSFGFSGTNAHVILEEAPLPIFEKPTSEEHPLHILTLSAKTEPALNALILAYNSFLEKTDAPIADICHTANTGRDHERYRIAVIGKDLNDLRNKLKSGEYVKGRVKEAYSYEISTTTDWSKLLQDLAVAYTKGAEIEWEKLDVGYSSRLISLPTYPFQRERFWFEAQTLSHRNIRSLSEPVLEVKSKFTVQPQEHVISLLIDVFSKVLKLPKEKIEIDRAFEEYGVDSILISQMNQTLGSIFGKIPSTLFYKYRNLEQLANYFEKEHKSKLETFRTDPIESQKSASSDIAIIGVSGVFPCAKDIIAFWDNLKAGKDCITPIPEDRKSLLNSSYAKWGGFIADVDRFDMDFFNISPIEARTISPNERLFLQEAWKCIESAGYRPENLVRVPEERVGVFVGVSFNDYGFFAIENPPSEKRTPPISQTYAVANRVSYFCDFKGPSFTVDTACSSSLYSLHLACESLLAGECHVALAGGINLTLHASKFEVLKKGGFLSPDGHCHSFGEGGEGYVPSEGIGVVLIKKLADAIRDEDNILGIIKGTGTSQDGKTNGFTVPNPVAQTEAINRAFDQAKIDPRTITYIEAHGTGTSLGDPIEITGLEDAFKEKTADTQFCAIASVKSNIGHCEAAAGISQVIKVLLQMQAKMIVPNIMYGKNLNPNIDFEQSPFYVQMELSPWAQFERLPRRAGVSSFGAGGANVHAILEEYISVNEKQVSELDAENKEWIVPLSAKKVESLRGAVAELYGFLKSRRGANDALFNNIALPDLAYTLQVGRIPMRYRIAFVVTSISELLEKLNALILDEDLFNASVHDKQEGENLSFSENEHLDANHCREIADAWLTGVNIGWKRLYSEGHPHLIYLPTYSFVKEKCWVESVQTKYVETPNKIEEERSDEIQQVKKKETTKMKASSLLKSLYDVSGRERYLIILDFLKKIISKKLEYPSDKILDTEAGFFDLGITSLQSIELQNEIESTFSIQLSSTAAFEYPTLKVFSGYIQKLIPSDIDFDDLEAVEPVTTEITEVKESRDRDIAIIGMAFRFPGGCNTPEDFWKLIATGGNAITEMPKERWNVNQYYDPIPDTPGKMYVKKGGFISQKVDEFDAKLFGISATEAIDLDPQQRLLLELTWEVFENANYAPTELVGSKTGVFMGLTVPEYISMPGDLKHLDYTKIGPYAATGMIPSLASGRISHSFGLQGPAISLDTACSSSLVAAHLACESILSGESEMALAGGITLLLSPSAFVMLSQVRALSPDGESKTFDASADGYGRSEGGGIILLKKLSTAIRDGDNILAVIKGSAVNQDGHSSGLTVPNGNAQKILLREALKNADLQAMDISYLEAHGTGTPLGDPIEINSAAEVFSQNRQPDNPLFLGAVKRNIGHTEAAAGIAGIIKSILCLQHKKIPPLKVNQLNPRIHLEKIPAKIPNELANWNPVGGHRYVGISSFGFSGTNAHMILTEAPQVKNKINKTDRASQVLALSAQTDAALEVTVKNFYDYCKNADQAIADIAYSNNVGRAHFSKRVAFVAKTKESLLEKLSNSQLKRTQENLDAHKFILIFSNFKEEMKGFALDFYQNVPTYSKAIQEIDPFVNTLLGINVSELLYGSIKRDVTLLEKSAGEFAIQYAMLKLWQSWGINPDGVYGESVGAYVAAVAAEVMDLQTALTLLLSSQPSSTLKLSAPNITFISSQSGKVAKSSEVVKPQYWQEQVHVATNTAVAVSTMVENGFNLYLQINPGPLLVDSKRSYPTILHPHDNETIFNSLAKLYEEGVEIDWSGFDRDYQRNKVILPKLPFSEKILLD